MEKDKKIQILSELVSRMNLASKLGMQFQGDRDIYKALGYSTELEYNNFLAQYKRHDIAKAIIKRPVDKTWAGSLQILSQDNDTFNKEIKELNNKFHLKSIFSRLDVLTSLGRYGILLLGLDDVSVEADFQEPVQSGNRKLLYLRPFGEGSIEIYMKEINPNNNRFGKPLFYKILFEKDKEIIIHYTRVLHVTGELIDSEIYGTPILEVVYNRLQDLEKIVGGSAEMFWKGARPGYQAMVDKEFTMTPDEEKELKDQIDEYEHNLRRMLVNQGVQYKALASQVEDPTNHVDIQIQMISAVTGIPKRILTGSERGELASTQDNDNWLSAIQERRDEFAAPQIVYKFIDICQQYNILSKAEYEIEWSDLFITSNKDKMEIGKGYSTAIKEYSTNPNAINIMPLEAFYRFILHLTDEQIEAIDTMRQEEILEEDTFIQKQKKLEE